MNVESIRTMVSLQAKQQATAEWVEEMIEPTTNRFKTGFSLTAILNESDVTVQQFALDYLHGPNRRGGGDVMVKLKIDKPIRKDHVRSIKAGHKMLTIDAPPTIHAATESRDYSTRDAHWLLKHYGRDTFWVQRCYSHKACVTEIGAEAVSATSLEERGRRPDARAAR